MSINDGMFRIRRPAEALRFTGERLTSSVSGGVEMEHLHRYCLARDLCVGRDVLDVASGEGYGAALLAGVARRVVGVERDAEAVEHARGAYAAPNLAFEAGDALDLPLPDGAVDVVVSFETLEHLSDQARFLAEVRRVLRPGGLFLVSTPDRQVHSGLGMPVNPHHVLELSRPEFEALLRGAFGNVEVLAQRTLAGSVLLGSGASGARARTYERRDATTIEATGGVARAVYLVAAASDGPLPDLPASLYADERSVDALLAGIAYERGEVAKARAEADRLAQAEAAARAEAGRLLQAEAAARAEAESLRAAAAARAEAESLRAAAEAEGLRAAAAARAEAESLRAAAEARAETESLRAAAEAEGLRAAAAAEGRRLRTALIEAEGRAAAEADRAAAEAGRADAGEGRADAEHGRALAGAEAARAALEERDRLAAELDALRSATGTRLGLYAAYRASRLPGPVRRALRRAFGAAIRARASLRGRPAPGAAEPAPPPAPVPPPPEEGPPAPAAVPPAAAPAPAAPPAAALLAARYAPLQPFPSFAEAYPRRRLSIVTDSVGPSSLFGGVGTSLLLGALLANRLGATLRLVTRTEPPDAAPLGDVLACNGVALDGVAETAFAPLDGSRDLPVAEGEIFLTTSWWTTRATLGSVPRDRIVALVQEDERMFYPHGDDRLRCAEALAEPGLPVVVNTELLFRHLSGGPEPLANLASEGMWFEPAFPGPGPGPGGAAGPERGPRRRLFFYARPNNLRNLFWRGLEALDAAAAEGIFPSDEWEMHWVGRDVPEVGLPRGVVPVRTAGMAWGEYQRFIASMDAGFVLMDTPHPSYPPLDLAAAGAAVLTNTHPGKRSLDRYSRNILVAPSTRDGLLDGLRRLRTLAEDEGTRAANRAADGIARDWTAALSPVVDRLARRFGG